MRLLRRVRRDPQSGVSLVEYALLIALLVIPAIRFAPWLTDVALGHNSKVGENVGDPYAAEPPPETTTPPPTTPSTAPPPTTTTTTTTPPTTTTAAPTTTTTTTPPTTTTTTPPTTTTTAPPTTTTTAPPTTTTTAPPTTTTTAPQAASGAATFSNTVASNPSGSTWQASTTLTIRNNLGQPIAGATVTVRTRAGTGAWVTNNYVTGANGAVVVSGTPPNGQSPWQAEVVSVQMPTGSPPWDQQKPSTSIARPS